MQLSMQQRLCSSWSTLDPRALFTGKILHPVLYVGEQLEGHIKETAPLVELQSSCCIHLKLGMGYMLLISVDFLIFLFLGVLSYANKFALFQTACFRDNNQYLDN